MSDLFLYNLVYIKHWISNFQKEMGSNPPELYFDKGFLESLGPGGLDRGLICQNDQKNILNKIQVSFCWGKSFKIV